jgi:hypothetical protein
VDADLEARKLHAPALAVALAAVPSFMLRPLAEAPLRDAPGRLARSS